MHTVAALPSYKKATNPMLSLPSGNTMTNTSAFVLKKGTTVLAGRAAPLFGHSGGGIQWWVPRL
ncbi:MAG: glycohydrolase toxin TNT-related protein [Clostridia bacterium]|nr:glycohydrolase toxin TNT-related protein [Clostridia bacterium]